MRGIFRFKSPYSAVGSLKRRRNKEEETAVYTDNCVDTAIIRQRTNGVPSVDEILHHRIHTSHDDERNTSTAHLATIICICVYCVTTSVCTTLLRVYESMLCLFVYM